MNNTLLCLFIILVFSSGCSQKDIQVSGFESGKFDQNWTVEGDTAFVVVNPDSVLFPQLTNWQTNGVFTGWEGKYLVHSGGEKIFDEFNRPKKNPISRLISPSFKIKRDYVKFLCGGKISPHARFILVVDNDTLEPIYGNNNFDLLERGWSVSKYRNKKAQFVAEIKNSDNRVLLRFDNLFLTNTPFNDSAIYSPTFTRDNPWLRPGIFKWLIKSDHTLGNAQIFKGFDGKWHMIAMKWENAEAHYQARNRELLYCNSDSLLSGWSEPVTIFTADEGTSILPPHVVLDNQKYLLYVGFGKEKGPDETILPPVEMKLFISDKPNVWKNEEGISLFTLDTRPGNMWINKVDSQWVMYHELNNGNCVGEHCPAIVGYRISNDLKNWSEPTLAVSIDEGIDHFGSAPKQVVKVGNYWYMIGQSGGNDINKGSRYGRMRHAQSEVLRSDNPWHWNWKLKGNRLLNTFGSTQLIQNDDDNWYIIHGGPVPTIDGPSGIWIAPLKIVD